jgi:hypothetical protein
MILLQLSEESGVAEQIAQHTEAFLVVKIGTRPRGGPRQGRDARRHPQREERMPMEGTLANFIVQLIAGAIGGRY